MAVKSVVYRPVASYKLTTNNDGSESSTNYSYLWNCDGTRIGTSVPRYREAIANLSSATSPYSVVGKDVEWSFSDWSAKTVHPSTKKVITYGHQGFGLTFKPIHAALPLVGSVKGAAVAKFYSKVADAIAPFKGLVFAAEMRESLATIGGLLSDGINLLRGLWLSLRDIRRALRRGLKRAKSRKRRRSLIASAEAAAANRYLAFTFGIEPLLADIESAYGVFCEERVETERIHAKSVTKGSSPVYSTTSYCQGRIVADMITDTLTEVRSSCTGSIKHQVPERVNSLAGSAEALGFSLREVIPTIWEVTPFSFLVDYFVNVGDLINTAVYGNTSLYYSCQSTIIKSTVEVRVSAARKANDATWTYKTVEVNGGPVRVSLPYWSFAREVLSPSNASVNFTIPGLGRKWVNMVALFVQWAHKFTD